MNKNIERASWEENIEYDERHVEIMNNIIVGIAVGVMIAFCGGVFIWMSVIG